MTFSDSENDGWGVCTLRSKKKFGKTSFVTYEFDLPKSNFVLPLKLGQQIELCCLDNRGNVAKGDFYVYHPAANPSLGRFSIIAPNKSAMENEYEVGSEASNFVSVLYIESTFAKVQTCLAASFTFLCCSFACLPTIISLIHLFDTHHRFEC